MPAAVGGEEKRMYSKFFKATKIYDNVTMIDEGMVQCYLVEGTERALLIDTLCGIGNIKAFVSELTNLPVTVVATHGHVDHVPGAFTYGEVYMNPDDIALMYRPMHSSPEGRLNYFNQSEHLTEDGKPFKATMDDVAKDNGLRIYPVYDGDIFDLGGGILIEVIQVPGHTYGTIVLLDRKNRVVFSGDACNVNTLLNLEGSTTIEEYKESLLHFKTFEDAFDGMWGGHGARCVPKTTIDDGIMICDEILAGKDDAIEMQTIGGPGYLAKERGEIFMPKYGGTCDIVYSKEMIHKRPHPVITDHPNTYK